MWNVKADAPGSILCRGSRINRNIVECKAKQYAAGISAGIRINRNIVECKDLRKFHYGIPFFSINRNIVECKAHCVIAVNRGKWVLIETLWNVKLLEQRIKDSGKKY